MSPEEEKKKGERMVEAAGMIEPGVKARVGAANPCLRDAGK